MSVTVKVDGQTLHVVLAGWLRIMNRDFQKATGKKLLVSSGYRSHAEQRAIFLARYRVQATGNGPYNDVRWYEGKRWVRVSPAGTVAVPGTSLHESFRAVDLRDSGADAGVTVRGTPRANWMRANSKSYGFAANGYNFGEPWHFEFTGSLTPYSKAHITAVQKEYNRLGYKVKVDGILGAELFNATLKFQKSVGLFQDGLPGPGTLAKAKATPTPTPPEPEPVDPNIKTTVSPNGVKKRTEPNTKTKEVSIIIGGKTITMSGFVKARSEDDVIETVGGSGVWFVSGGHFYHDSGFTNKSTEGMVDLTETLFPTPEVPEIPEEPQEPEIPEVPEVPGEPQEPSEPEVPEVPKEPAKPGMKAAWPVAGLVVVLLGAVGVLQSCGGL